MASLGKICKQAVNNVVTELVVIDAKKAWLVK